MSEMSITVTFPTRTYVREADGYYARRDDGGLIDCHTDSDVVWALDKAAALQQDLAAACAEVEKLTRDRDGWERRTKEIGSVVIRAWALLRDWWQYAQLEEREEPFVDALTRALAADAEHDAYALAEIRRWRDMAGEAARLRGVLEEVREQLKFTGVSSALLPMVNDALAAQEADDAT